MMTDFELLGEALEWAKKAGADAADISYHQSHSTRVECRDGKIEKTSGMEDSKISMRVFVGKRAAKVFTGGLERDTIKIFADQAVAVAKHAPEDPYVGLVPSEDLSSGGATDLDTFDTTQITHEVLRDTALEMEDAAKSVKGVRSIKSASAGFGSSVSALCTTNGFVGERKYTYFDRSCSAIAAGEAGMELDSDWSSKAYFTDLDAPAVIGESAGRRAVAKLGGQKITTGQWPVMFSPRVSNRLISILTSAISGPAIAKGMSFMKDAMAKQVFSKGVDVIEDPHRTRSIGSRSFDGEGVATRRAKLVDDGRLTTWLLNKASADQLGLELTGHGGSLGTGVSPSNLYMANGEQSCEDLMADIEYGFFVTEMMGHGINPVTGNFSYGAAGFLIEGGEITVPVKEATIAGNMDEIFPQLTPANDLEFRYGTDTPTLRVDGMTSAG